MTKDQILSEAMSLDPREREALAEDLWLSVDHKSQQEIDAAWAQEIEERIAAHERGEMSSKPVDEVIQRLLRGRRV